MGVVCGAVRAPHVVSALRGCFYYPSTGVPDSPAWKDLAFWDKKKKIKKWIIKTYREWRGMGVGDGRVERK